MTTGIRIVSVVVLAFALRAHADTRDGLPPPREPHTEAERTRYGIDVYVRAHHVPATEARRRLRLQSSFSEFVPALREEFRDRFAGLYLEHAPVYRVVVRLTGNSRVPDRIARTRNGPIPISFRTGAKRTEAQALAALERNRDAIAAAFPTALGMAIDPSDGLLHIELPDRHPEVVVDPDGPFPAPASVPMPGPAKNK